MLKITAPKMISKKRYKLYDFTGAFEASFGKPERGKVWLVSGNSGNGKTEMCMQLLAYMKQFGKCAYYSKEQGDSSSMKEAIIRNGLQHVSRKEVDFLHGGGFEDLVAYLKRKKGLATLFIDSIDYLKISIEQIRYLIDNFKKITIIFIAWAKGTRPKSMAARDLEYMADVKVFVNMYVAEVRSRFGGNQPYIIWREGAAKHHAFLNI